LNQKRFKIIARFDLPTLFAGMVGIDSLYLFQIPQLTLSPHLSFSIQAQLVFSHLLPDPNIPCFEPACSAEFLRERGLSLRKGKASLFTHCALRISLRMG